MSTDNKKTIRDSLVSLHGITPGGNYRLATDIEGPAYLLLQGGAVVREFTSLAQAAMWLDAKLDTVREAADA